MSLTKKLKGVKTWNKGKQKNKVYHLQKMIYEMFFLMMYIGPLIIFLETKTYLETASINGNDAQVVIFRDKSVKIMWLDEKVFITIDASENKEELLKMARSLKE